MLMIIINKMKINKKIERQRRRRWWRCRVAFYMKYSDSYRNLYDIYFVFELNKTESSNRFLFSRSLSVSPSSLLLFLQFADARFSRSLSVAHMHTQFRFVRRSFSYSFFNFLSFFAVRSVLLSFLISVVGVVGVVVGGCFFFFPESFVYVCVSVRVCLCRWLGGILSQNSIETLFYHSHE